MRTLAQVALIAFVLGVGLLLWRCNNNPSPAVTSSAQQVITVKKQGSTTKLFFTGNLAPLKTIPVLSPVNGRVKQMHFLYGDTVERGQPLVTLSSTDLADNYRKAINDFLQKKSSLAHNQERYQGSMMLYQAGVISREEYSQAKTQVDNDLLGLLQSRYELEKVLQTVGLTTAEVEKMDIKDTQKVNALLQRKFDDILIKASGSGVALFPEANSSGGDNKNSGRDGKIMVGSDVKQSDLLLSLGDLQGLTVKIEVSEVNINSLRVGMDVTVTGDAFPDLELKGKVIAVSAQAQQSSTDNSTNSFQVLVHVPKITAAQRKILHVGMSARVELDIPEPSRIMVPINALSFNAQGKPVVKVKQQDGKIRVVEVTTGSTSPTEIAIVQGLQEGDQVIVINPAAAEAP